MRHLALTLLAIGLLCACGQKGALYLPGDERERVGGNTRAVPPQSPNPPAAATAPAQPPQAGTTADDAEAATRPNVN
jgi:predicted small lipoprotein YifL